MKIALLGDTHFGVRNDNQVFLDHFQLFYENVFFPYIDKHDIRVMMQVGDLVDHRKHINFNTAYQMRNMFLNPIQERELEAAFILGNHDVYYKNTNYINAQHILLGEYGFQVFDHPTTYIIGDVPFCILPWINSENYEVSMKKIEESDARFCVGHLEIAGFEMYRGVINEHGLDADTFNKFDLTMSGHFHHISKKSGICYLGTPYEMTWQDYDDPRGFHILDTVDGSLEFIQNPYRMFHKITYDSDTNLDVPKYDGAFVKVIVKNKEDPAHFEKFVDKLAGASDVSILDDVVLELSDADIDILEKTTLDIMTEAVEGLDTNKDKDKLKFHLHEIYKEALTLEG